MSKYQIKIFNLKTSKKIPKPAKEMLQRAIEERLTTEPSKYGEPLLGDKKNHRRLRVSYYRIVYHVDESKKIVTIKAIDYRKDIYKNC